MFPKWLWLFEDRTFGVSDGFGSVVSEVRLVEVRHVFVSPSVFSLVEYDSEFPGFVKVWITDQGEYFVREEDLLGWLM